MSLIEPSTKRTCIFIDGQNLFNAVKQAFGYSYPNFDPSALAKAVCSSCGWAVEQVHFYTGIPEVGIDPARHLFWTNKLAMMKTRGIVTFWHPLRYQNQEVTLPDGAVGTALVGREKGVDVRIALDVVRMARQNVLDVALIFSQDQDFSEVAKDIRQIAQQESRWIKVASAFPHSPASKRTRGIHLTDWIRFDKALYDSCIDPIDYRLNKSKPKL